MPPEVIFGPPWFIAPPSSGQGAWGEARFEWVDPLNLRAPPFVLDDAAEAREWPVWRLDGVARDKGSVLGALEATREPFEVCPIHTHGSCLLSSCP